MRVSRKALSRALWSLAAVGGFVGATTIAYAVTLRAAGEKAQIRMLVLPTLVVQKYSDLTFRSAPPGAKAEIISPRSIGSAGGVKVVGTPNQAYTLFLPSNVNLLRAGQPGAVRGVNISDFTSYPDVGAGLLGTQGQLENKLGATRNELAIDLPTGLYEGNYSLTVAFP